MTRPLCGLADASEGQARGQIAEGDAFMAAVQEDLRRVYGPNLVDLIRG